MLLRRFYAIFVVFLCFFAFAFTSTKAQETPSTGADYFRIDLHSTYTVTATGKTLVEQKFTITNKTPELFVSKYGIVVSSTTISNVGVTHNGEALEPALNKNQGQTSIGVTFDDPVVGEGKRNELIIRYSDEDSAVISGKVLEVNIPKLADQYQYETYQLDLRVPSIFDTPSRINPSTFTLRQEGDYNVISYTNPQDQSIRAHFGQQQLFDLKLSYYLNNPSSQTALTQITLPPETPYQQVHYLHLEPLPQEIKEDADGNFIATYKIPANNSFSVELLAQVKLQLRPNPAIPFSSVLSEHLAEQKFWEQAVAEQAENEQQLKSIKSIYDYTVKTLQYTNQPIDQFFERLGAMRALEDVHRNQATCQEYTDLFIALSRAHDIPTRRVVGIAYSTNEELRPSNLSSDILHTWPEYYNHELQAWIPVDPTWESTTGGVDYFNNFDLNHIALAINGVSSSLPYPAGSYTGAQDEKNKKIYLEFTKYPAPEPTPEFSVDLLPQTLAGLAIPGSYTLQVMNQTGKTWYVSDLQLSGQQLEILSTKVDQINKILPFAKISVPISVYNTQDPFKNHALQVTIALQEGQVSTHEFQVKAKPPLNFVTGKRILTLGGGLIVITLIAGSLFLLGRKLAHSVRRQGKKLEEEDHKLQTIATTLKENQTDGRQSGHHKIPNSRQ